MQRIDRATEADEFCLVLTPTRRASQRASEAVRGHFQVLPEGLRRDLAEVVGALVQNAVDYGPGKPITVTIATSAHSIRGEVADQGNPAMGLPQIGNGANGNGNGDPRVLLDRVTSHWAVQEGSTDVWFEIPLVTPD